jgi:hypothetical protein
MIRRASAVRFDRIAERGRNEPLRIAVETQDGEEREVFLKPSGRAEVGIEGMANELLAACIAAHLGLPVCEPLLVHISPEWVGSILDPELRAVLVRSSPVAFASTSAGTGWRPWTAEDRIIGSRRQSALSIFAFDAFTENRDRIRSNPNLLVRGDTFRIIDHELCFKLRLCLFPRPEPWRLGYLDTLTGAGPNGHVFGALLKGDRYLDVASLKPAWSSLSDEVLSDYGAAMPPEWHEATEPVADALKHLKAVRDRIDECLLEVKRALA